jgi:hypothetical protein
MSDHNEIIADDAEPQFCHKITCGKNIAGVGF